MKKRALSPWLMLPFARLKVLLAFCVGCAIMAMAILAHLVSIDVCKNMMVRESFTILTPIIIHQLNPIYILSFDTPLRTL